MNKSILVGLFGSAVLVGSFVSPANAEYTFLQEGISARQGATTGQYTGSSVSNQTYNINLLQPVTGGSGCSGCGTTTTILPGYLQSINNQNVQNRQQYKIDFVDQNTAQNQYSLKATDNCNCGLFNKPINGAIVNYGNFSAPNLPVVPTFTNNRINTTIITTP